MAVTARQMKAPSSVLSAIFRMGSSVGLANSRNIRVLPVDADKKYEVSTAEGGEQTPSDSRPSLASAGWEVVQPKNGGTGVGIGPLKKLELPDRVV